MFKRGFLYGLVLIVTVVIPWLVSSGVNVKNWAASLTASGSSAPGAGLQPGELAPFGAETTFSANQSGAQRGAVQGGPKLVGAPVSDLGEVLRFEVSPQWVMSRWSRVSTVLADLELEGLRVPLVTGTTAQDLAGSLTYYFDKQHQVQRITFHGYTGDESKLAALVAQRYQLKQVQSLNAALYLAKWNGAPTSALRVALAPVVRADSPNTRLEVMLEINRPRNYYGLSPEFKELLEREQQVQRW